MITGFRVARGGAQELYGVTPDLTILGKIAGGGLPLAAFGGRADVMDELAPAGPVYQAGTLSGNPLATAAALVVLRRLRDPAVYERLEEAGARLEAGLREAAGRRAGLRPARRRDGDALLPRGAGARTSRTRRRATRTATAPGSGTCSRRGVYVAPSQFEALFVSTAHGEAEIDATVEAAREFFRG